MSFLPWRKRRLGAPQGVGWLKAVRGGADLAWLTDDLAIGPAPLPAQWRFVFESGIGAVLEVRQEDADDSAVIEAGGATYLRVEVRDHQAPTQPELRAMVEWVLASIRERRRVLVHCGQGLGRSATVACATLVAFGFPLDVAYQLLRRAQPDVALSRTQVAALEEFTRGLEEERRRAS